MKYIVMLGDGMADYPIEELGKKTPLEAADKPNIDRLAKNSIAGMVKTVPDSLKPGSDVANLAVMGYNPLECYSGRSPLEAVSMGIEMEDADIAIRCNLVTLSEEDDYRDKVMVDYSSGEITTEEAAELIEAVDRAFHSEDISFYSGISYRHCMIWKGGHTGLNLTPPHDISDRKVTEHLPENQMILDFMKKSYDILKDHPVNKKRVERGLHPANSIWLWGEGTKPNIFNFEEHYGVKGSVISAVDLIKGIGICSGMEVIEVEGATGNEHTNFRGKMEAALDTLLSGQDFVYIHVEAPDECGHRGDAGNKVYSIEMIDKHIVGPILHKLEEKKEEYAILVLPDHPTPVALKTHTSDPVPFIWYRSDRTLEKGVDSYTEENCKSTGILVSEGYTLLGRFLAGEDFVK